MSGLAPVGGEGCVTKNNKSNRTEAETERPIQVGQSENRIAGVKTGDAKQTARKRARRGEIPAGKSPPTARRSA